MADKLYGGLSENKFRSMAKKSVVEYWNANERLVKKFGKITVQSVYVVWLCKIVQNNKALLGVSKDGDGMYFEFTRNGDAKESYLDVYKKQKKVTVKG